MKDILRSVVSFLGDIGALVLYLVIGGSIIAGFYNPEIFYIHGAIILLALIIVLPGMLLSSRRLRMAQEEYSKLQEKYGYSSAKDHCPHRVFTLSQKDLGVMTMTDKWCRVCGKHLGPAKLRKSIFGNKWE